MAHNTAAEVIDTEVPTREELLHRARELSPILRERAQATEDNRKMLEENVQALIDAGFMRISQPASHGGYEMHPTVIYEVAMELAKGCSSSAWFQSLMAVHNWEMALLGKEVCDELWSENPDTLISSSYAPFGKVEKVEGGYKLSGRWPWSSGSDHCQWVILGAILPPAGEGGIPDYLFFLLPRAEYEIIDTWHVTGLCGTGSNDIVVDGAFVPDIGCSDY